MINTKLSPLVSIIVPIYNAENTLEHCINSVLNQNFTDFELVLADDGSTDRSGQICDTYSNVDSRILVIHKENTGVSDTRNLAIQAAKGTYLQFLDSDDWLDKNATKALVTTAERYSCDLVVADFYRVIGEKIHRKGSIPVEGLLSQNEYAKYMLEKPANFYYGVLWNKLYRRDIVLKRDLEMDAAISWCEDFIFNLEYLRYTKSVFILRIPIYYYVKTPRSLSTQAFSAAKVIQTKATVFEYYRRFYKETFTKDDYGKNRFQVYRFFISAAGDGSVPHNILSHASARRDCSKSKL